MMTDGLENFSLNDLSSPHSDETAGPIATSAAYESVKDLTSGQDLPSPGSLAGLKDGVPVVKARPYQKEMVEESLSRNIIVAMDTGSGKTHIAVMRMLYELEHLPSNQVCHSAIKSYYILTSSDHLVSSPNSLTR